MAWRASREPKSAPKDEGGKAQIAAAKQNLQKCRNWLGNDIAQEYYSVGVGGSERVIAAMLTRANFDLIDESAARDMDVGVSTLLPKYFRLPSTFPLPTLVFPL